jgi:hypothetical protein
MCLGTINNIHSNLASCHIMWHMQLFMTDVAVLTASLADCTPC